MSRLNILSLIELGVLSELRDCLLENFCFNSKFTAFFMDHDMVKAKEERWVCLEGLWQMILHCVE
jgi:hypothetical protein